MQSPYEVLGIDPDADDAEVDRAYRRRVLETHPDRGGSTRAFKRVTAAYEALTSGEGYDASGVGADAPRGPEASAVEYLDYEVLVDRGWDLREEDLFRKAAAAGLDRADHGRIRVEPGEPLLEAAERCGLTWPYACRGGACANCAIAVVEGEMAMPANHILPPEMTDRSIRLSCNGSPVTEEMKVVVNIKHRPDLDELRLPPHRFVRDHA